LSGPRPAETTTDFLGLRSSLRAPSHLAPQALARHLPGPSPWKELALAGIQDANSCGRDIATRANGVKSVLAGMDSKSRALFVRAEGEVLDQTEVPKTKSPNEILKGVGATAPFDFWDPAGFATDLPEGRLLFYREVELKHGRICMLASLGILVAEKFHPLFPEAGDLPAYIQFQNTPLQTFWIAVAAAIALPEALASIPTFQEGTEGGGFQMKLDRVPGDLGFDPLGLKPTNEKEFQELQNKEINNGRLAMFATAGMIGQELATGQKLF